MKTKKLDVNDFEGRIYSMFNTIKQELYDLRNKVAVLEGKSKGVMDGDEDEPEESPNKIWEICVDGEPLFEQRETQKKRVCTTTIRIKETNYKTLYDAKETDYSDLPDYYFFVKAQNEVSALNNFMTNYMADDDTQVYKVQE